MSEITAIPDGVYFLSPEGSAWEAVAFSGGRITDSTSESLLDTHTTAGDSWDGIQPDEMDEEVDEETSRAIIRLAMSDDTDPSMVAVTRMYGHADIVRVLLTYGDTYSGGSIIRAKAVAEDWAANDFSSEQVGKWCGANVWDASTAAELRDGGLSPRRARQAADALVEDMNSEDAAASYTFGDPIYAVCNNDISATVIIEAAND